MDEPFTIHPRTEAQRTQQVARALLDHAGADPGLDVFAGSLLDHHVVDLRAPQQMRQKHSCRPAPDDRHLRAHGRTINEIDGLIPGSVCRDDGYSGPVREQLCSADMTGVLDGPR